MKSAYGKCPLMRPESAIEEARRRNFNWHFNGFVDDVRPYMQGAAVSVIPLRVGGGTRLKVYESMTMDSPIVSTGIGVEGLPVQAGRHYLQGDDPAVFAEAIVKLMQEDERRLSIAREARTFVEQKYSYTVAARAFEDACRLAIKRYNNSGTAHG